MISTLFKTKPGLWWGVLLAGSVALSSALHLAHLPAAVLLGCMLCGIGLSAREVDISVPKPLFVMAQGLLGCLIAKSLELSVLSKVAHDWPLFLGIAGCVMAASAGLGWVLMRRQILPGTTAIWGLAPGAASAMVLMAEDYGADVRLVAFMQYLRVVIVTAVASLVAGLWTHHAASVAHAAVPWFMVHSPANIGFTLLLAIVGSGAAVWFEVPGGAMLVPLVSGIALQSLEALTLELPAAVLVIAYAVIGWSIGLRFTRSILMHAWRVLPKVLGAILVLIGVGAVLAVALVELGQLEPLTAYLATSPGGADSVAVIAATSAVDAGFVMAMQMVRFVMVLLFGPHLSKFVAKRTSLRGIKPSPHWQD